MPCSHSKNALPLERHWRFPLLFGFFFFFFQFDSYSFFHSPVVLPFDSVVIDDSLDRPPWNSTSKGKKCSFFLKKKRFEILPHLLSLRPFATDRPTDQSTDQQE